MRVKTFGALRFEDQYGRERFLETRKTAALAAFLAVQPGKRFRREVLADLLWGGKDDSSARHSLSQAVCLIRRNLGSGLLEGHPQYLSIPHGAAGVDAIELSALMEGPATRDDLEAVERLYGGDFLDGLDVCQEDFDIWIRSERDRLRQLLLKAMGDLLALKMRSCEFSSAHQTAMKMLQFEPFEERIHRALMRCYLHQGQPRRVVEHYKFLSADLHRELGVWPEQATKEIYQRALNGDARSSGGRTLSEFAFVLEQLPYSVVITDTANHIVGWNRVSEEVFGFTKHEMFGRSPTVIYAPDHDSGLANDILSTAIAQGRWIGEVSLTTKGGRQCRQKRVVAPLFGPEGEMVGAFGHGFSV